MRTPALAFALLFASLAQGQITDEALEERLSAYTEELAAIRLETESNAAYRDAFFAAQVRALRGIEFGTLTARQIFRLQESQLLGLTGNAPAAMHRCAELLRAEDEQGALAAMTRVRIMIFSGGAWLPDDGRLPTALRDWLEHPEAASTAGESAGLFGGMHSLMTTSPAIASEVAGCRDQIAAFAQRAMETGEPSAVAAIPPMLNVLASAGMPEEEHEALATRVEAEFAEMLAGDLQAEERSALEDAFYVLTLNERRAALVGNPMPAMNILWSSDDSVDAFEDYRGRVLVLDFWATWCPTCIESFPQVRDLRAKYAEYRVAIVGVTSPQSQHFPDLTSEPIDCSEDPEKEFALMPGYMVDRGITWDVVFTSESFLNRENVIEDLPPHVVIIDPVGVIRHRALHPSDADITAKIDALLEAHAQD